MKFEVRLINEQRRIRGSAGDPQRSSMGAADPVGLLGFAIAIRPEWPGHPA